MKRGMLMLVAMCLCFVAVAAAPAAAPGGDKVYAMVLATNQRSTGPSETATNVGYCTGSKVLEIKVSGAAVAIDCTIMEGTNGATVKTISLTAAGTYRYTASHYIESLYVQSAITRGVIDSITLRCN